MERLTCREAVERHFEEIQSGQVGKSDVAARYGIRQNYFRDTYSQVCKERGSRKRDERAEARAIPPGLSLLSDYAGSESPDGAAIWEVLATRAKAKLGKEEHTTFEIGVDDSKPIALAFIADQHIGGVCDYERMAEDAEIVRSTDGLYAIMAGDGIDNMIKHASSILHSHSSPDEQLSAFDHYLSLFGDKILCMVAGNHDLWTSDLAGVDSLRRMVELRRIIYSKYEMRLTLSHHGYGYRVWIRHKARWGSMYNRSHSHQQNLRMGEWEWDIGVLAHLHEVCCMPFEFLGQQRWAIRPGSYKRYDAWAKSIGFQDAVPKCPTVVLYPGERRMVGFENISDAARFLGHERRGA